MPTLKRDATFRSLLYHLVTRTAVNDLPLAAVPSNEQIRLGT